MGRDQNAFGGGGGTILWCQYDTWQYQHANLSNTQLPLHALMVRISFSKCNRQQRQLRLRQQQHEYSNSCSGTSSSKDSSCTNSSSCSRSSSDGAISSCHSSSSNSSGYSCNTAAAIAADAERIWQQQCLQNDLYYSV